MKTLVVDDDAALLETLREVLEHEGHTVLTASSGEQALRQWDEAQPDMVLLDIGMPGMDGYEVCRRLRQWDRDLGCTTPIIMLTARTSEADELQGLAVGADDYVTKPFSIKQLTTRMQTVLRRYQEPPHVRVPAQPDDQEQVAGVSPTIVAEGEVGALYHDREADRWIVDLDQMGVTLHFASGEFSGFLQLLAAAAGPYGSLPHGVSGRN